MPEGDITPTGDPIEVPSTTEHTDDSGNTTVTGYPSGGTQTYEGTPGTEPGVPDPGTGEVQPEGQPGEPS